MYKLLFLSFSLPCLCFAQVFESSAISDVLKYTNANSLVLFDLDNTIMEPKQLLGSDQWFESSITNKIASGFSKQEALEYTIPIYNQVHNISEVIPVEPHVQQLIAKLTNTNLTFALTSRGKELSSATIRQVRSLGIEFSKLNTKKTPLPQHNNCLFQHGIIYSSGSQNKGSCLLYFLQHTNIKPKHILLVDDKGKNIEIVANAVKNHEAIFTGLRYSFLDAKVATVDLNIANIQIAKMQQLLSDSEAKILLQNAPPLSH